MSKPSLSVPGNLVITPTGEDVSKVIPIEYVVQYIQKYMFPSKKLGDKVMILESATGSGKSFVMTQRLADFAIDKMVGVVQPTKKNAESIPTSIADGSDGKWKLGVNIGFRHGDVRNPVRPERGVGKIMFMTTQVLVNNFIDKGDDYVCKTYRFISIDEVHMHDLPIDLMLFYSLAFLERCYKRDDCPIFILTSATLEPEKYMEYFGTKHYLKVTGTSSPLHEHVPKACLVGSVPVNIVRIIKENLGVFKYPDVDTVVFLPSMAMVDKAIFEKVAELGKANGLPEFEFVRISGSDKTEHLTKIPLENTKGLRIFFCTNSAETGITFTYAKICIDTGLERYVVYNPSQEHGIDYMGPIAYSSIVQRKGRVGRNKAGYWFPLFPASVIENTIKFKPPEVYRKDMSGSYLEFLNKMYGITYDAFFKSVTTNGGKYMVKQHEFNLLRDVRLINQPTSEIICNSLRKLITMGAITSDLCITELGVLMIFLNRMVSPELTICIYEAQKLEIPVAWFVKIAAVYAFGRDKWPLARDLKIKKGFYATAKEILNLKISLDDDFLYLLINFEHYEKILSDETKLLESAENKAFEIWSNIIFIYNMLCAELGKFGFVINTKQTFSRMYTELMAIGQREILMDTVKKFKYCLYKGFINNLFIHNPQYKNTYCTVTHYNDVSIEMGERKYLYGVASNFVQTVDGCVNTELSAAITEPKCLLKPVYYSRLDGFVSI